MDQRIVELFLEAAEIIAVQLDSAGKIVYINGYGADLLGKPVKSLIGKDWFSSALPSSARNEVRKIFESNLSGKMSEHYKNFIKSKKGNRMILWHNLAIQDEQGAITGTFSTGIDITETTEALREISEKEAKFRSFFEASPQAMVHLDLKGRIVDINNRVKEWLGFEPGELVGKNFLKLPFLSFNAKRIALRNFFRRVKGKNISEYEIPFFDKHKHPHLGRLSGSLIIGPDKKPRGVLLIIADISETNEHKAISEKFRLGVEKSNDVIFITDIEGYFQHVNPSFTKLYGYTWEEVKQRTPRILKSGLQGKSFYEDFWKKLLAKQNVSLELKNKTKAGTLVDVFASVSPILSRGDDIIGFLAIQKSVTEVHRMEREIKTSKTELERRVKELEAISRISVGRELRMIELKKRIKQLEAKK